MRIYAIKFKKITVLPKDSEEKTILYLEKYLVLSQLGRTF